MMGRKQLGAFNMKNLPKIVRYFLSRTDSEVVLLFLCDSL